MAQNTFNYWWVPKKPSLKGVSNPHRLYVFLNSRGEQTVYAPNLNLMNIPSGAYYNRFIKNTTITRNSNRPRNFHISNATNAQKKFMKNYLRHSNPAHVYIMATNIIKARKAQATANPRGNNIRHQKALKNWEAIRNIVHENNPTLLNTIRSKLVNRNNKLLTARSIKTLKAAIPLYGPQRRNYNINSFKKKVFANGTGLNYYNKKNVPIIAINNTPSASKNSLLYNTLIKHWNNKAKQLANRQRMIGIIK